MISVKTDSLRQSYLLLKNDSDYHHCGHNRVYTTYAPI